MSNELNIALDPYTESGLTLIAKVINTQGVQQGSDVSMTEGTEDAFYTGDFDITTLSDNEYAVRFETNTPDKLYGNGKLYVRGGIEVRIDKADTYTNVKPSISI